MSGEYPAILRRRAEAMLALAQRLLNEGEYDLAVLNAEYAAQLYLKSLLYRLTGEEWRGHGIRELLGALAVALKNLNQDEGADEVAEYVRRYRAYLAELEEGHVRSVYGVYSYGRDQAEALVSTAGNLISFLQK